MVCRCDRDRDVRKRRVQTPLTLYLLLSYLRAACAQYVDVFTGLYLGGRTVAYATNFWVGRLTFQSYGGLEGHGVFGRCLVSERNAAKAATV